jgi:hypothetical protein
MAGSNLKDLISGVISVAVEALKTLEDGFQPLQDGGALISLYHSNDAFKAKVDGAIKAVPNLGADFKGFDASSVLTLAMSLYPEVQTLVSAIGELSQKKSDSK